MSAHRAKILIVMGLVAWPCLLWAGCAGPSSEQGVPPERAEPVATAEVDGDAEVTVRVIDEAAFARVLEQYPGKVVLVDFWATWCLPCVELFPHTVQLHKQFADQGLATISVSFDDPDNKPAVLNFLTAQGATFDNFISRYGGAAKSAVLFEIEGGGLPHYKLYDRSGTLRKIFPEGTEPYDAADIDRAVEELLTES